MSKLFEKMARSAGTAFAEKLSGSTGNDIEIYQFQCDNDHIFFIQIELPQTIHELTETFSNVVCPVCQNKLIKVKKTL